MATYSLTKQPFSWLQENQSELVINVKVPDDLMGKFDDICEDVDTFDIDFIINESKVSGVIVEASWNPGDDYFLTIPLNKNFYNIVGTLKENECTIVNFSMEFWGVKKAETIITFPMWIMGSSPYGDALTFIYKNTMRGATFYIKQFNEIFGDVFTNEVNIGNFIPLKDDLIPANGTQSFSFRTEVGQLDSLEAVLSEIIDLKLDSFKVGTFRYDINYVCEDVEGHSCNGYIILEDHSCTYYPSNQLLLTPPPNEDYKFYYWNLLEEYKNESFYNLLLEKEDIDVPFFEDANFTPYISIEKQFYDSNKSDIVYNKKADSLTLNDLDKFIGDFADITLYFEPAIGRTFQNHIKKLYPNSYKIRIYRERQISASETGLEFDFIQNMKEESESFNPNHLLSQGQIRPEDSADLFFYIPSTGELSEVVVIKKGDDITTSIKENFVIVLMNSFPAGERNIVVNNDIKISGIFTWDKLISPKILIGDKWIPSNRYNLETVDGNVNFGKDISIAITGITIEQKDSQIRLVRNNSLEWGERQIVWGDENDSSTCYCIPQPAFYVTSSPQTTFSAYNKNKQEYKYYLTALVYLSGFTTDNSLLFANEFKKQFRIKKTDSGIHQDYDILNFVARDESCYAISAEIPITRNAGEMRKTITLGLYDTISELMDQYTIVVLFTEEDELSAPVVTPTSPAVYVNEGSSQVKISIPFEYPEKISSGKLRLKLFDMNNQSILDGDQDYIDSDTSSSFVEQEEGGSHKYRGVFWLEKTAVNIGEYYKGAISIESESGIQSPWSNLTIFKVTAYPVIDRGSWLRDRKQVPFFLNDVIYYSSILDKTEPLQKIEYNYFLKVGDSTFITPTVEVFAGAKDHINYQYIFHLNSLLDFKEFREWCMNAGNEIKSNTKTTPIYVTLEIIFYTKNGSFYWQEPGSSDTNLSSVQERFYLYDEVNSCLINEDIKHGLIHLDFKNDGLSSMGRHIYNGDYLIFKDGDDKIQTVIDQTALYANEYLSFRLFLNQFNNYQLRLDSFNGYCDFDGQYLIDVKNGLQLNISYNNAVSSFKYNRLEQKTDTIGSQYPVFFRNPYTNYREFPLTGTISYQSLISFDDKMSPIKLSDLKMSKSNLRGQTKSQIADNIQFQPHLNLTGDNIYNERIFREKVMEFLLKDRPLLYKSQTEGNIVVKLMNIQLTPNKTLGRMVYDFSCTCYEVQDLQSYLNDCVEGQR